jgi:nitroreductase
VVDDSDLRTASVSEVSAAWPVEVAVIVVLLAIVSLAAWWAYRQDQQEQRSADIWTAAVSGALAVERVAGTDNGSYRSVDGKTDAFLRAHGYEGPDRITIRVTASGSHFCLVAEDIGLDSQWRDTTFDSRGRSVVPGAHC